MKVILAYSGGLDTSVALRWLMDKYKAEVITYTADLGQGEDLEKIREKALNTGASKAYVEDLKEEFLRNFVFPALKAGALYEGKYPLATALGRPLIAKRMVELAKREGADAVAHGCTGKGNDQVRFEVSFYALSPHLKVIAPAREWEFKSREEEVDYALKKGIPVEVTKKSPYSIDKNIWGVSIECGDLEDPDKEPPEEAYQITTSPQNAPSKPLYMEIDFEEGIPVKLDGEKLPPVTLVEKLSRWGADYGVGRIDMVEDRLVGIKSREIYEAPAAEILHTALRELESLVLDKESRFFKETVSSQYSRLVYFGLWYSPLREALDAFVERIMKVATGKVKIKLEPGRVKIAGRSSPYSLYQERLATYSGEDIFDHSAATGFINLWGLPLKIKGMVERKEG